MIKELELFLQALEKATGHHYIQHLKVEPMLKPAFKKVTLSIHNLDDKSVISTSKVFRITDDEERHTAYMTTAEELITIILKNAYEASTP